MNALLQTPIPPPPAPVAQQPLAAPAETAPPGQAMHMAVATAINPASMSDDKLKSQLARFDYVQNALRGALAKGDVTHEDAVKLVSDAVAAKAVPAAEAGEILGGMTTDPAKLRAEMEHRHRVALHGMIALSGEQAKRQSISRGAS